MERGARLVHPGAISSFVSAGSFSSFLASSLHFRRSLYRLFNPPYQSSSLLPYPTTMTLNQDVPPHAFSIAPMMDVTDRHWRTLARLITRRATLWTEMVVDKTIIHNQNLRERELRIPPLPIVGSQHPVVLQLGGSVPEELEQAARIAADYGYDEINLNCGCPSAKVAGKGCFGAALMRVPDVVAEATRRMKAVVPKDVPITVKCRIGVDDDDSFESLAKFITIVSRDGGVEHFIIHARKAILKGLSPAQNRSVPPLKYEYVHRLITMFPKLTFTINGGVRSMSDVLKHRSGGIPGVMVGRAAMDTPWKALCNVDRLIYGDHRRLLTRRKILELYKEYAADEQERGVSSHILVKPLLNLFHGEPRGKLFRRALGEETRNKQKDVRRIIDNASRVFNDSLLDKLPLSDQEAPGFVALLSPAG